MITKQLKLFNLVLTPICRKYATRSDNTLKQLHQVQPRKLASHSLQNLLDRSLLVATFPDTLVKDLTKFDSVAPKIYTGIDPTSSSLHVGNLIILNALLQLYADGFEVFVLIGGATCKLGDPSGKYTDRETIDWDTVKKNSDSIQDQILRLFENYTRYFYKGDKNLLKPVRIINNVKWYENVNVIDFLDTNGRLFRVKHLLEKQAIKSRLTSTGMNLNEFLYQIFQAYDFLKLYDEHGCLLQLGGTDQIGNVHAGHDMIKKTRQADAFGLFCSLMTDEKGEKLGKSQGNAIALCPRTLSPFHFYQHFVRLHDTVLRGHLSCLTSLAVPEIDSLCTRHMKRPEERAGQRKLAELVTLLVHGQEGLEAAQCATQALFHDDVAPLLRLTPEQLKLTFGGIPSVDMVFRPDVMALELLLASRLVDSEEEARSSIKRGLLRVNGLCVGEEEAVMVRDCHVLANGLSLLRLGKRQFCLVRWHGL